MSKEISPNLPNSSLSDKEIRKEFNEPIGIKYNDLKEIFDKNNSFLFIVNDAKRDTATSKTLKLIIQYLKRKNLDLTNKKINTIVATGSHPEPTERELKNILSSSFSEFNEKTEIHDSKKSGFLDFGKTTNGTPIKLNEAIKSHDVAININSVDPHPLAGFTGGRKSLIPGLASYETIEKNHELGLHKNASALELKNNPVHNDMKEGTKKAINELNTDFFGINMVNSAEKIFSIKTGNFYKSFSLVTKESKKIYSSCIKQKHDLVIAKVKKPFDKNLYQSLKAFENTKHAVKSNGALLIDSACDEGIGRKEFYKTLKNHKKPKKVIQKIEKNYELGDHVLFNLLDYLKNHKIYLKSKLNESKTRNCFLKPISSVKEAKKELIDKKEDKSLSTLIVNEAAKVVPIKN